MTLYTASSISSTGRNNILNTVPQFGDDTVLDVHWHTDQTWSSSGGSETDIVYLRNLGTPQFYAAVTWCDDESSTDVCDQHYIRFEDGQTLPDVICHETAHGVGLTHGEDADPFVSPLDPRLGCLGDDYSTRLAAPVPYQQLNIPNINSTY